MSELHKKPLKLLFIFSSGNFESPNNRKWFELFGHPAEGMEFFFLIQDCDEHIKTTFYDRFPGTHRIILFKEKAEFLKFGWYQRLRYLNRVSKQLRLLDPDVVHVHGCYFTYPVITFLWARLKAKLVFNVWGNDFNHLFRRKLKHRMVMLLLFRKASLIWANWHVMEDALKRSFPRYRGKIRTILQGIEKEAFIQPGNKARTEIRKRFGIPGDAYIISYIKGFAYSNNQINLIKSLAHIRSEEKYFLILHYLRKNTEVGDKLEKMIRERGLEDRVVISQKIMSMTDIKALVEVSDLSLSIPSKDQLSRTVFETILANTNLVVSNISPYRILREKYNFGLDFVDEKDPESISEKIDHYLRHKPEPSWEEEKKVIHREFNFSNKKDNLMKIYRGLVSE